MMNISSIFTYISLTTWKNRCSKNNKYGDSLRPMCYIYKSRKIIKISKLIHNIYYTNTHMFIIYIE